MGDTIAKGTAHVVNGAGLVVSPLVKGGEVVVNRLGSFKAKVSEARKDIKSNRKQRRSIKAAMHDGLAKVAATLEEEAEAKSTTTKKAATTKS